MTSNQTRAAQTLTTLSVAERAQLLDELIRDQPDLAVEADRLANRLLQAHRYREIIAEQVTEALKALGLSDLADRAGAQWGGGYVEPHQAAFDILLETLQPFLDDLTRRALMGATSAATEIAYGALRGLYACRTCRNNDLLLSHAGLPDAADDLACSVVDTMTSAGLVVDREWMAAECPEWPGLIQES